MIQNFKLTIEYDGTDFFGWQRQKDQKTVQGELEKALSKILNQTIRIAGSGRTDAGVHAFGQVASFKATTKILPRDLKRGVNSLIKQPIVVRDCSLVSDNFHAQYSAVSKEYRYYILNRNDPSAIGRQYHWHIRQPLNIEAMNECCNAVIGVHDFKSFENTGSPRSSTVREIFFCRVACLGSQKIEVAVCASGFLKYMVRNLVGTLVQAGQSKITAKEFKEILEARDRTCAGPTAPAQGLFLKQVNYP